MSTNGAIASLVRKARSLPKMKLAPNAPVEDPLVFPFAVAYESRAETKTLSEGLTHDLVTLFVEIHVSRLLLPHAIDLAMSFRDPFLRLLIADPTLEGEVSTTNDIRRSFGRLEWGGDETIGYRFEIDVKVNFT